MLLHFNSVVCVRLVTVILAFWFFFLVHGSPHTPDVSTYVDIPAASAIPQQQGNLLVSVPIWVRRRENIVEDITVSVFREAYDPDEDSVFIFELFKADLNSTSDFNVKVDAFFTLSNPDPTVPLLLRPVIKFHQREVSGNSLHDGAVLVHSGGKWEILTPAAMAHRLNAAVYAELESLNITLPATDELPIPDEEEDPLLDGEDLNPSTHSNTTVSANATAQSTRCSSCLSTSGAFTSVLTSITCSTCSSLSKSSLSGLNTSNGTLNTLGLVSRSVVPMQHISSGIHPSDQTSNPSGVDSNPLRTESRISTPSTTSTVTITSVIPASTIEMTSTFGSAGTFVTLVSASTIPASTIVFTSIVTTCALPTSTAMLQSYPYTDIPPIKTVLVTEWVTELITTCPSPPPSCSTASPKHVARQAVTAPQLKIKVSFITQKPQGDNLNTVVKPVRMLPVFVFAKDIANPKGPYIVSEMAPLDGQGNALVTWKVPAGVKLRVEMIKVRLESLHGTFKLVSSATDEPKNYLVWLAESIPLSFTVESQENKRFEYIFRKRSLQDKFTIHDTLLSVYDFSTKNVFPKSTVPTKKNKGDIPMLSIWYPSSSDQAGADFWYQARRIQITGPYNRSQDVIAHEYGHYVNWLAAGKRSEGLPGIGEGHGWCDNRKGDKNPKNGASEPGLAFTEGWAYAFGVAAIDNIPEYQFGGSGSGNTCDTWNRCDNIDIVDLSYCNAAQRSASRDLLNVEVRNAAAVWDLYDSTNEPSSKPTVDSEAGRGNHRDDLTLPVSMRHNLFWKALETNPSTIEEYWHNLKVDLSPAQEAAAWDVLQYNYANAGFKR